MSTVTQESAAGALAPAPRSKRKGILPITAAVALSVLAVWASTVFTREPPTPPAQARGMKVEKETITLEPDAPQWKAIKLGAAQSAESGWSDKIPARIQIDQRQASRVGSPLAGRVTAVHVELGQHVRANDPLFTVASPEIAALKSEEEKCAVDLGAAQKSYDRVRAMVEARALPAKEELSAKQTLAQAELAAKLATSKLASLRVSSGADNEFTVVSPRSGVVVEKNLLPEQEVQSDAAGSLLTVADLSDVWVIADLFEAEWTQVRVGTEARVSLPYLPGETLDARVDAASAVVDPVRHTVPIRLHLNNSRALLRPNSYAEVRLAVSPPTDAVEIPPASLVSDGDKQYVMVQGQRGEFKRRPVVAGAQNGEKVLVLSGLKPGEMVAEEGAVLLENQLSLAD